MKKLVYIFALLLTIYNRPAEAQTAAWDSTFRPPAYNIKVDQFRSYKSSPRDFVFLGNSITANTDWAELLSEKRAKNRGISADITFGVLERLSDVTKGMPSKIFLLIGINDISRNIPDELIVRNLQRIVSRVRTESPRTRLYIHTLMPVNHTFNKFPNHYGKDQHILFVNDAIRKLADNEKVFVIDLYPAFLDKDKRLISEFTHDGLHLTAAGYKNWVKLLRDGKYLK
ncbi:GDSL-type esterase/lipase family protein [Daejeonella lutea]|uniref:Lysophospholipase L1 n=1 Tax=Daejeonella lutea TaxID=572036 RepID=A0A1T5BBQ3_9SPHI|nr:GDSL-type esterase/lipase family protein [Daejeonella lutea]SKB44565.1 Lysophospholipase L1 [Daejeonella lutea]